MTHQLHRGFEDAITSFIHEPKANFIGNRATSQRPVRIKLMNEHDYPLALRLQIDQECRAIANSPHDADDQAFIDSVALIHQNDGQ